MKRKKRKIFRTPEERSAWEAKGEAVERELQAHIDRIRREPGIFRSAEEREAWTATPEARHRYLLHRIELAQVERAEAAKRKSV